MNSSTTRFPFSGQRFFERPHFRQEVPATRKRSGMRSHFTFILMALDKVSYWADIARQRRQLRSLSADADFLNDVGLSRIDVLQEANKPFWRK